MRCNVGAVVASAAGPAGTTTRQVNKLGGSVLGLGISRFAGLKMVSSSAGVKKENVKCMGTSVVRATAAVETAQKTDNAVVEKSVNTIRFLAIDAVEKANSGHPGLPMGCAPMGHILYDEVMKYNPKNPYWFNRDRFVLSAGHGGSLSVSTVLLIFSSLEFLRYLFLTRAFSLQDACYSMLFSTWPDTIVCR